MISSTSSKLVTNGANKCVCVLLACMHTCISAHVAVGGQLARVGFLLLPCGSCKQGPSLPESSCQLSLTIFLSNLVSIFILAMLLNCWLF